MEHKKRVGIWIRVSTDRQVEDDSPEHHEMRAKMYAQAKGWEVAEVYRLDGVSGKSTLELPVAKKMLQDLKAGKIEALVFSKLARLGRNTKELLEFSEIFQKEGKDLISLAESIDTSTAAGRMFFTIIAALAQWEREEIAARVAASVPIRAKLGKPLGGAAPYGYKWEGEGKDRNLIPDEREAPVRKLMYELFTEHQKKGTVAKKLNDLGYRTRNGSKFTDTTIARLLHDSTAKGVRLANYTKSTGEGKKWVFKPESEWITVTCPAIVSTELWDACDKILRKQESENKRISKQVAHLFSGILTCECGGKMYVYEDAANYKCSKCRKVKIGISDIEEIYFEQLGTFLMTDDHLDKFLKKADEAIAEKLKQLEILQSEKKRLEGEMDKLTDLYLAGEIPKEGFGKKYGPIDFQVRNINSSIPDIQAEIDFLRIEYLNGDAVIREAKSLYDRWNTLGDDAKRVVAQQITNAITVGNETITIKFRYNPAYFENPAFSQNAENTQRNLRDS